ncbi:MAG: class I SAM-dependent rRNA methyltransferase [Gammaproteobacteria bacterium]|nr:class I SAM-dependent rRNA methyltransferase [Gammaproteobacteria bacterium]
MANPIYLKKGEEKRILAGHLWVFSNEVDTGRSPLKEFAPGEHVALYTHRDRFLGMAYINPHSLICARIYAYTRRPLDRSLLAERISSALKLRASLYTKPYYRLINSEGDFLPGLVVDRYGETLSIQINTAGMEAVKADLLDTLQNIKGVTGMLIQNDNAMRSLEQLTAEGEETHGEVPEEWSVYEGEARFRIIHKQGQKTGWFYDQRTNRERFKHYAINQRVLDVCSYAGGWSISALLAGARTVTAIDASQPAIDMATQNARLNGVNERFESICGKAFDALEQLLQEKRQFDVIVTDPPAFIKRKKDFRSGLRGYEKLAQQASRLLAPEGILVSCSCSQHLPSSALQRVVQSTAHAQKRFAQVLEYGHQAPDHPMHPAMPETAYLKAIFSRLTAIT